MVRQRSALQLIVELGGPAGTVLVPADSPVGKVCMIASSSNPADVRGLANQVLARARNDNAYLGDLQSDPVPTLQAAGFTLDSTREFS